SGLQPGARSSAASRGRGDSGKWVIRGDRAMRRRQHANCAFGVIAPAIRIGVFLAGMMDAGDLIFESGTVALLDDRRRYEDEQVALGAHVVVTLEEVAEYWDIAHERHFGPRFRHFVLQQAADC